MKMDEPFEMMFGLFMSILIMKGVVSQQEFNRMIEVIEKENGEITVDLVDKIMDVLD